MDKILKKLFLAASVFIFFLSITQITLNIYHTLSRHNLIDFAVYRGALEKFWLGENPYNYTYAQEESKGDIAFNYPPSALVSLSFLGILPWKETQILFIAVSFLSLWLSLWFIWKLSDVRLSYAHFFILLAFFTQTFPVKFTIILGQVNLFVLFLTCGTLYFYLTRKSKSILAAVLFAWSGLVKLFSLAMLPLFVFRRNYSFVFMVLLLFIGISILPYFDLFREYYFSIGPSFSSLSMRNYHDQSIFAFLLRVIGDPVVAKNVGIIVVGGLYIILLFFGFLGRKAGERAFLWIYFAIFALTAVSNFFSWQHHLVFTYPLILLLYLRAINNAKNIAAKVYTAVLFLGVWGILVYHFQDEQTRANAHPVLASYQTFLILILILISLVYYYKDFVRKK